MKVMGLAEVAERLGWSKQHAASYLARADQKGFPPGMFPKPFQKLNMGLVWWAEDVEEYAKGRK